MGIPEELAKTNLFRDIPKSHLKRIARLVEVREVAKDEVLVREGTFSREFFVVFSGTAIITVRGRRRATSGRGDFFGELAILGHSSRTATVTASSGMKVGVIQAQDFQHLIESEPKISLYMLTALAQRFEELTQRPAGELR